MISKWTLELYREEVDKLLSVVLPISSILLSALSVTGIYIQYKHFVSVVMLPASVWATINTLLNLYGTQQIPELARNIIILLLAFPLSLLAGLSYIKYYGLLTYLKLFAVSIPFFLIYSYLMRLLVALVIENIIDWLEEITSAVTLSLFVVILILINIFAIIPILYSIWSMVINALGITT